MSRWVSHLFTIAAVCALAARIVAAAGVTITGSVVDSQLTPIVGATIVLERGGHAEGTTSSDAAGKFTFSNITPGTYRVRAEHVGFPTFARELRIPASATSLH